MKTALRLSLGVSLVVALATPAVAQIAPPAASDVSLAGPRFGVTVLSDSVVQKLLREDNIQIAPVISQFGWQFEKQFYGRHGGPSAITEAVVLVGGLEQGVVLPSLSWLVGVRTSDGFEFGVGPNITPVGVALAAAMGRTFRVGILNVPVNMAVVPSKAGLRVSFLTGFALRR